MKEQLLQGNSDYSQSGKLVSDSRTNPRRLGLIGTAAMFLSASCVSGGATLNPDRPTECDVTGVHSVANSTHEQAVSADNTDKKIKIYIDVNIPDGTKVRLAFNPPDSDRFIILGITTLRFIPNVFEINNSKVITELGKVDGEFFKEGEQKTFTPGSYDLAVLPQTGDFNSAYCTATNAFEVIEVSTG